jgi:hypothetical protein
MYPGRAEALWPTMNGESVPGDDMEVPSFPNK